MQPHLNLYGSNNDGWQEDGIRVNLSKDYPIVVKQELVNAYSTYSFDVKNFIVSQVDDGMATFVLSGREIPSDLLDPLILDVESAFTVFARDTDNPPRLLIEYAPVSAPIVETDSAAQIAVNSAMISAEVVSSGGEVMTERGIEYRRSGTSDYTKVVAGAAETGNYTVELIGLSPSTSYEVRAYATNAIGTSYGSVITFTTNGFAATMSADQALTEENLHGRKLTVTLSDTTFKTPLNASDFTLQNAPKGLTISQVERTSNIEALVTLSFDGTDFDSDHFLGLTVAGTALTSGVDLIATPPLPIIATNDPESISLSQLDDIWEGEEDGKKIIVTLEGGTFAKTLTPANWTVNNLPPGVSKGTVARIDAETVHITLNGNATGAYVGDITNVTVSLTPAEYDDSTGGASLSANSGIELKAHQAPTVATGTATEITATSVTLGGGVTSEGTKPVIEQGIEYRKSGSADNYTKLMAATVGSGIFTVQATGLEPSTTYDYRAYAKNDKGITYDVLKQFSTMALSQNAELQNIVLSIGSMNETFSPNDYHYTADVGNHVREVQITATTADLFATMEIAGQQVLSGHPSQSIPLAVGNNEITIKVEAKGNSGTELVSLNEGKNVITIVVTAQGGATNTYTIIVTRESKSNNGSGGGGPSLPNPPSQSNNTKIEKIAVSLGEDDLFEFNPNQSEFEAETEAEKIVLTAVPSHSGSEMTVNGETIEGETELILEEGDNIFDIVVTAEDGTTEAYTLTINRLKKVPFQDVREHWAEEYIKSVYRKGWFQGYPDGSFGPDKPLTRMQSASLFVRILGLTATSDVPFTDIASVEVETIAELEKAFANGVVNGFPDGTFKPYADITRAQFALMIYRTYEQVIGTAYTPEQSASFPDIAGYDEETQKAIAMLVELGIAEGDNGEFKPNNRATRAHAAKLLVNFKEVLDLLLEKK